MSLQYDQPPSYRKLEADKNAQSSLVFGILAVTVFPLVFAPLALVFAKKAEDNGVSATAGKILGWIGVGLAVLTVIYIMILMMILFTAPY